MYLTQVCSRASPAPNVYNFNFRRTPLVLTWRLPCPKLSSQFSKQFQSESLKIWRKICSIILICLFHWCLYNEIPLFIFFSIEWCQRIAINFYCIYSYLWFFHWRVLQRRDFSLFVCIVTKMTLRLQTQGLLQRTLCILFLDFVREFLLNAL